MSDLCGCSTVTGPCAEHGAPAAPPVRFVGERVEVFVPVYGANAQLEPPTWRAATITKVWPPDGTLNHLRYTARLDENGREVCVSSSIRGATQKTENRMMRESLKFTQGSPQYNALWMAIQKYVHSLDDDRYDSPGEKEEDVSAAVKGVNAVVESLLRPDKASAAAPGALMDLHKRLALQKLVDNGYQEIGNVAKGDFFFGLKAAMAALDRAEEQIEGLEALLRERGMQ